MAGKPAAATPKAAAKEADKEPDKAASASAVPDGEGTGEDAPGEAEDPLAIRSGVFSFSDGSVYQGEYRVAAGGRVERHGRGEFRSGPERYDGEWDRDRMHGRGRYTFATGAEYDGELAGNCFHGQGAYRWADGARYEGGWAHSKMHGDGAYVDRDGVEWRGRFVNGKYDNGRVFHTLR